VPPGQFALPSPPAGLATENSSLARHDYSTSRDSIRADKDIHPPLTPNERVDDHSARLVIDLLRPCRPDDAARVSTLRSGRPWTWPRPGSASLRKVAPSFIAGLLIQRASDLAQPSHTGWTSGSSIRKNTLGSRTIAPRPIETRCNLAPGEPSSCAPADLRCAASLTPWRCAHRCPACRHAAHFRPFEAGFEVLAHGVVRVSD